MAQVPSNIPIPPSFSCFYCNSSFQSPAILVEKLNKKTYFCSMKCFEIYSSFNLERRLSKEFYRTPHPKDLQKALQEKESEKK